MLKLSKYEFRKSRTTLIVIGVLFLLLEGYFLVSIFQKNQDHTLTSVLLLYLYAFVCFFMVFILSIVNYSKELSSKSSYLIFMTPNSALNIILSKLFTILVIGIVLIAAFGGILYLDTTLISRTYSEVGNIWNTIILVFELSNVPVSSYVIYFVTVLIEMGISFFGTVTLVYLAITLSATLFQNNRFRGIISFVFFILLSMLTGQIQNLLPTIYSDAIETLTMTQMLINLIPSTLLDLCIMILCILGCDVLLEKKVSL